MRYFEEKLKPFVLESGRLPPLKLMKETEGEANAVEIANFDGGDMAVAKNWLATAAPPDSWSDHGLRLVAPPRTANGNPWEGNNPQHPGDAAESMVTNGRITGQQPSPADKVASGEDDVDAAANPQNPGDAGDNDASS